MSEGHFALLVIGVIVLAGCLGGCMNFLINRRDNKESANLGMSFTMGVGAAFLVPLFLNMISSSLLNDMRGKPNGDPDFPKILVFAGFCLVAAVSSTAFIKSLSDRILQEAKDAKKLAQDADKKASETKSAIEPIVEQATEQDTTAIASKSLESVGIQLTDNERKILETLANGRYVLRTRTGLSRDTGIAKPVVDDLVEDLKMKGLVDSKDIGDEQKTRIRWFITPQGRNVISERG